MASIIHNKQPGEAGVHEHCFVEVAESQGSLRTCTRKECMVGWNRRKGAGLDAQQGAVTHSVPDTVLCSTQLWNDTGETLTSAVASFRIGSLS